MKLTIIGGGSIFTPMLLKGLEHFDAELPIRQVSLLDIDDARVQRISSFTRRNLEESRLSHLDIFPTTDHQKAIKDSDFIIITIRVGGLEARVKDEKIPLKYGIFGDETTGPGGFSNCLRTIPILLEYASEIEKWAPDAWVIPFSNPEGILTEAFSRYSNVKVIGLCTAPFGMKQGVGQLMGIDPNNIELDYFGITHTAWVRGIRDGNQDILPGLLAMVEKQAPRHPLYPLEVMRFLDMYPAHWFYTLAGHEAPHWYYHNEILYDRQKKKGKTRGEELLDVKDEMTGYLNDEDFTIRDLKDMRGHQVLDVPILSLLSAIANDKGERHIVDIPCGGVVDGFDPGSVLEIPAQVDSKGAHPLPMDPISAEVRGLVQMIKAYEELTVEAAASCSYSKALQALIAHPLVMSYGIAKPLLDDILAANKAYLPSRWGKHGN